MVTSNALQEPVMSFALLVRRSSFVAVALSLTAFGAATMPAAAKPQPFPGPGQPQFPPPKPVVNPNPPKPVVNPPKPGPIVKPIDICVIMPSKCVKPVGVNPPPVIVAPPPVVVEPPPHVIVRPEPVYVPRPVPVEAPNAAAASSESCNCLTKQYQSDGSVVFRDLCTHEAAMATQADLQPQAQSQDAPAR